jgi:hypothetical protein
LICTHRCLARLEARLDEFDDATVHLEPVDVWTYACADAPTCAWTDAG